ncbi:glycosyltransferase family 4 protein [Pusillimonas sp.]|uniref:glycosyltransferase family 4 protein n=1 Tax=Pusillimonas sp. TaxID=3040095 RepID=UPI0029A6AC52|nr:glycosyltransferase family 4 protein [Pusillimonas sp.]MDX3894597.1 glycosyltransferase family 4 protein [Pusillimonas sp.]
MRILQLNFERGWRGGERQTLLCLRHFRAAGHHAALLARRGEPLARAARDEGFEVHEVQNAFSLCGKLLGIARRYDILHAQTANTLTWLALLKPVLRRPIVFTRRTAFPVSDKKQDKTRWKWRRADLLAAISEAAAAEPRRLGLPVAVIPSAIEARPFDIDRARAFSEQFDLQGRKVIATVAALTREKDPCTLVRAVHALRRTRDDFIFLHLGAGGDAEQAARSLAAELDVQDCYLFAGFQQGVEDIYRLMDVFVLASAHEALGTSVLDAFLYSVPVVSTNAGGLAEVLADGRGLLCEVGDHEALARAMGRVLDDAGLRSEMVRKAHAFVLEQHDPRRMAHRYLDAYQAVLTRFEARG